MWPEDEADWPDLVLQMARSSLGNVPDYAVEPLSHARERFVAASDYATAAQAETLVGFGLWNQGLGEEAAQRFRLAADLVSRGATVAQGGVCAVAAGDPLVPPPGVTPKRAHAATRPSSWQIDLAWTRSAHTRSTPEEAVAC